MWPRPLISQSIKVREVVEASNTPLSNGLNVCFHCTPQVKVEFIVSVIAELFPCFFSSAEAGHAAYLIDRFLFIHLFLW